MFPCLLFEEVFMKIVLVTGASRGIGKQIAITLSQSGYTVIGTYNNSAKDITYLSQQYGIDFVKCNVADYTNVKELFDHIVENYGRLDATVNCAGISYVGLLQDMTEEQIINLLSVNLNGTIYISQKSADIMVKQHSGNIVNISSVWGNNGASCEAVYSASKGGINAFTKALAQELAPSGIRVNAICPGVIKTDMLNCFSEEDMENLEQETPLGRIGTTEDIANMVDFILSEKASFVTGQIITVDGGFAL